MKNSHTPGSDVPAGSDLSWKAFMVFFVIFAGLVAMMEMLSDKDERLLAANRLCQESMQEIPEVNGTLGLFGVKQGWWEAEAIVEDGEMVHVVCKRADVRTLGTVE